MNALGTAALFVGASVLALQQAYDSWCFVGSIHGALHLTRRLRRSMKMAPLFTLVAAHRVEPRRRPVRCEFRRVLANILENQMSRLSAASTTGPRGRDLFKQFRDQRCCPLLNACPS